MPSETHGLASLFRAVAAGDSASVSRRLRAAPELARAAIDAGARRGDPGRWFVPDAGRYIMSGDTALHFAAASFHPSLCRRLLDLGADVHARNRRGVDPLHAASGGAPGGRPWNPRQQAATIRLLIESGADPNCADAGGTTALHRAVRSRSASAVATLLERGADPRAKNKSGSTPLHLAVQTTGRGGSGTPEAKAQQSEIIRLLIQHGARASDTDGRGKTVAQRATQASLPYIARLSS